MEERRHARPSERAWLAAVETLELLVPLDERAGEIRDLITMLEASAEGYRLKVREGTKEGG